MQGATVHVQVQEGNTCLPIPLAGKPYRLRRDGRRGACSQGGRFD
jgi:hypothetical protein